jgi:hypothetical protein
MCCSMRNCNALFVFFSFCNVLFFCWTMVFIFLRLLDLGDGLMRLIVSTMENCYINWKKKRLSCLLSCPHQTHNRISVYPVYIISYLYPVSYPIMSLFYSDHQTDPKCLECTSGMLDSII